MNKKTICCAQNMKNVKKFCHVKSVFQKVLFISSSGPNCGKYQIIVIDCLGLENSDGLVQVSD